MEEQYDISDYVAAHVLLLSMSTSFMIRRRINSYRDKSYRLRIEICNACYY